MPGVDLDSRCRLLTFLHSEGMPVVLSRVVDAAAAQYAYPGGDPREYATFADECFACWTKDRTLSAQDVLRAAVRPPSSAPPTKDESGKDAASSSSSSSSPPLSAEDYARACERDDKRRQLRTKQSICPKCRSVEFTTMEFEKQSRASDEGGTPWRQCENPKCKHEWKVHGIEVNERGPLPPTRKKRKRPSALQHGGAHGPDA